MMLWAVVAEWVKGGASEGTPRSASQPRTSRSSDYRVVSNADGYYMSRNKTEDDPMPLLRQVLSEKSRREQRMRILQERERYKEGLDRGSRLGYEINLETTEDVDSSNGRHLAVTYQADPTNRKELNVNIPREELFRISWSIEHDGDTALVAYNYNTIVGHNANWMISGSGGPLSITSRGELGESDFEQENDLTIRSDLRSHPFETDLNGAIRINYITDNVDFRWKGAVKYPLMRNAVKISHGIERQELHGCCWTLKAEMSNDDLPWRAVRMETIGPMTNSITRIEHIKAEIIRNLTGAYDLEFEAKKPFILRGVKWTSRLRHKNSRGLECLAFVEGDNMRFRGLSTSCNYGPVKNTIVSCAAGFQPEDGWNMSMAVKLGERNRNHMNQNWNIKTELKVAEGLRRRQAEIDLFVPLSFPISF